MLQTADSGARAITLRRARGDTQKIRFGVRFVVLLRHRAEVLRGFSMPGNAILLEAGCTHSRVAA
jgi:hypothetical protein